MQKLMSSKRVKPHTIEDIVKLSFYYMYNIYLLLDLFNYQSVINLV